MLSFTATSSDSTINKSLEFCAELNETNNTWTMSIISLPTTYFITNYVFHHQINSLKSVSKMFKLCENEISYKQIDDLIEVNIIVDYIDDELITFELSKVNQNYEEILMKKVSSLEDRILMLEEENKKLKEKTYKPKSVEGIFYIRIDEEEGKFDYKAICNDLERQEEFEEKMLEAFKSVNIDSLNDFLYSGYDRYISESSLDKIRETIKKIIRTKNVHEIWNIMSDIRIIPKNTLYWNYSVTYLEKQQINVNECKLIMILPSSSTNGFFIKNCLDINTGNYSYMTSSSYVRCGNFYGILYSGENASKSTDILYSRSIKFSFTKLENKEEFINLEDSILRNIKMVDERCITYDTFGDFYDKGKKFTYIYDI